MILKKKLSLWLLPLLVFAVSVVLQSSVSVFAFNSSNQMDDGIFERSNSMSAAQIDTFINQFSNSCVRSQSGFVTADPQGWSSSQNKYMFGGNVTIGQAIYDTAQLYHVNPQVIMATMQKEQSIITGAKGCHYDRPNPTDNTQIYTCTINGKSQACTDACPNSYGGGCMYIAMSYGCPGSCAVADEGFSLQLTLGTWLLRFGEQRAYGHLTGYAGYEQGDENFCYYGIMTAGPRQRSAVNYNGCSNSVVTFDGTGTLADGSTVSIINGATSSLYNYTPYIDSNFDTIFQGWFGSLYDVYTWSVASQYAYTDQTKATPVDLTNLVTGQKVYIGFTALNTGTASWSNSNNPVHAGTTYPQDRNSAFCDTADSPAWLGCSRSATMAEASVDPAQTGTFEFWYKAPQTSGTYDEHFSLVAEGLKWMGDPGMYFHTVVKPPTYTWSPTSQYAYTDQSKSTPVDLGNLVPGQKAWIGFTAKNTGNVTWTNSGSNPVDAGTSSPLDRSSSFCDTTDSPAWLGCNRPARMTQASVAPAQTATFEFWYKAPAQTGTYKEYFRPVVEGIAWMNDTGMYYSTAVHFDTSATSPTIGTNQSLNTNQSITSTDGRYRLAMQGDGNFVLYSFNRPLWSSGTAGKPVTRAIMQGDGNLVLYDAQNKAYWSSNTAGKGTSTLVIQTDGNLVVYDSNSHPTWFSATNGQL